MKDLACEVCAVYLYSVNLLCFEPKSSWLAIKSLLLYFCYWKHLNFYWRWHPFKCYLNFGKVAACLFKDFIAPFPCHQLVSSSSTIVDILVSPLQGKGEEIAS